MKNLFKFSFLLLAISMLFVGCKGKTAGETAKTGAASGAAAVATAAATTYNVNTASSKVFWVGSKPTENHNGTIDVAGGQLSVTDGKLVSGNFTLNMSSITVTDLAAGEGKEDLEGHLKGLSEKNADHFFNVTKYPTADFVITKVDALPAGGDATHNITGDLTIKSTKKSITFPANVNIAEGKISAITPPFKINRTEWGVNYGSKSIFDDLKDKFINDDISLNIQLEASK